MSKDILNNFNEVFQVKARLGIMTILLSERESDFNNLKTFLNLTDGNLSSHVRVLEDKGYLEIEKKFVDRKPRTLYRPTDLGEKEFIKHLEQMKFVVDMVLGEYEQ